MPRSRAEHAAGRSSGRCTPSPEKAKAFDDGPNSGPQCVAGSGAVTGGGLVFVGNDNGFLYVLDAEVEGFDADEDDWKKMQPPPDLKGIICSSPALSTNVDGTGRLWLFVTSRGEFTPGNADYGTLWAFTVEEKTD